jgi:hypothetical protein
VVDSALGSVVAVASLGRESAGVGAAGVVSVAGAVGVDEAADAAAAEVPVRLKATRDTPAATTARTNARLASSMGMRSPERSGAGGGDPGWSRPSGDIGPVLMCSSPSRRLTTTAMCRCTAPLVDATVHPRLADTSLYAHFLVCNPCEWR